jgi:hypothetical protein
MGAYACKLLTMKRWSRRNPLKTNAWLKTHRKDLIQSRPGAWFSWILWIRRHEKATSRSWVLQLCRTSWHLQEILWTEPHSLLSSHQLGIYQRNCATLPPKNPQSHKTQSSVSDGKISMRKIALKRRDSSANQASMSPFTRASRCSTVPFTQKSQNHPRLSSVMLLISKTKNTASTPSSRDSLSGRRRGT